MSKIMLIDAAHAEETRVAVVDGTRVEEFDFESRAKKQLRGNIYLAKITRVEPSLQAAFVEYGGDRYGFLAFNEIHPDYYQIPLADREALLREEAEDNERHGGGHNGGGGRAPRSDASDADGDAEDAAGEDDDDVMEEELERRRRRLMRRYKIQEVIKRRQIMLVQVVKDERGNKGASLTTYLSLAGRYCVLMPNTARGGGISRKIATATDRKRLKDVIQSFDVPDGMGLIVRTAGAKRTKAEIKRDYEYLDRLWENIRDVTLKSIAPALIYEEEDLVKRAIRDMYDKDVDGIMVEGEEGYREARDFMRMLMPASAKKIQAYRETTPLFVKYKIEDGLAAIYSPVAPLKSGGYLVINQTEALVAIDVNSGKSTRERNIETTALKTNLEAAEEAARQLRLRDLAGLIVIDFIDMDESKNNRLVEKTLKDALKDDRARIQMGKISSFGLMELSRQRRRTGVLEGTTHVCEHCQGQGRVRAVESSALSAIRAVEIEAARHGAGAVTLRVAPAVGLYILNEKRANLLKMHQNLGLFVSVVLDETLGQADHDIARTLTLAEGEGRPPADASMALGQLAPVAEEDDFDDYVEEEEDDEEEVPDDREPDLERASDEPRSDDDEAGRGRRRRRRRGRGGDHGGDDSGRRPETQAGPHDGADSDDAGAPGPHDDDGQGEDEAGRSRRRRRRGRRGGRRPVEEARPADGFAWTRARTPDGSDPYGWYDTAQGAPRVQAANETSPQASASHDAVSEAPAPRPASTAPASDLDVWVELPAPSDAKPARSRRGRGRGRDAEAPAEVIEAVETTLEPANESVEAPAEVVAEAAVEAPVEAKAPAKRTRKPKAAAAEVAAEAVEAPVVLAPAPAPEPEVPSEPDPTEVTSPPVAPKRGWWRRGG